MAELVADAERDKASPGGPSNSRMLRVEVRGLLHDWFDVSEMGDFVRSPAFAGTLRENVARYFNVPVERQAIYDEDGLLTTCADFSRALQRISPKLYVYDLDEMGPELRGRAVEELRLLDAEIEQSWRNFGAEGPRAGGSRGPVQSSSGKLPQGTGATTPGYVNGTAACRSVSPVLPAGAVQARMPVVGSSCGVAPAVQSPRFFTVGPARFVTPVHRVVAPPAQDAGFLAAAGVPPMHSLRLDAAVPSASIVAPPGAVPWQSAAAPPGTPGASIAAAPFLAPAVLSGWGTPRAPEGGQFLGAPAVPGGYHAAAPQPIMMYCQSQGPLAGFAPVAGTSTPNVPPESRAMPSRRASELRPAPSEDASQPASTSAPAETVVQGPPPSQLGPRPQVIPPAAGHFVLYPQNMMASAAAPSASPTWQWPSQEGTSLQAPAMLSVSVHPHTGDSSRPQTPRAAPRGSILSAPPLLGSVTPPVPGALTRVQWSGWSTPVPLGAPPLAYSQTVQMQAFAPTAPLVLQSAAAPSGSFRSDALTPPQSAAVPAAMPRRSVVPIGGAPGVNQLLSPPQLLVPQLGLNPWQPQPPPETRPGEAEATVPGGMPAAGPHGAQWPPGFAH